MNSCWGIPEESKTKEELAAAGVQALAEFVKKDDFMDILRIAHDADAIIAEAPIYYNCMAAQMMTVINRLCCTLATRYRNVTMSF